MIKLEDGKKKGSVGESENGAWEWVTGEKSRYERVKEERRKSKREGKWNKGKILGKIK